MKATTNQIKGSIERRVNMQSDLATVSRPSARAKRTLDIICLLLTLPAWLPLMAVIALTIKAISPGPVLFVQQRIGQRGRGFRCLKFRTMEPDANQQSHRQHLDQLMASNTPMIKLDRVGDPRLIPGGAWLRASGLDELPQLLNVMRGEMSLVGPRPCTPYEFERYLPWQKARFQALPGLTGLWQVSGKNHTTFTQMIQLDIKYAQSSCLLLDLKIMARTLGVLFDQIRRSGRGKPLEEISRPKEESPARFQATKELTPWKCGGF